MYCLIFFDFYGLLLFDIFEFILYCLLLFYIVCYESHDSFPPRDVRTVQDPRIVVSLADCQLRSFSSFKIHKIVNTFEIIFLVCVFITDNICGPKDGLLVGGAKYS